MPSALIGSFQDIGQDDNVDDNSCGYVKAVKASNGEKQITEVHVVFGRDTSPPVPFMVKMRPLVCLAGKECNTSDDGPYHPFSDFFSRSPVTGFYRQHHGNTTHDEDKGHNSHENQWGSVGNEGRRLKDYVRIRPVVAIAETDCPVSSQQR